MIPTVATSPKGLNEMCREEYTPASAKKVGEAAHRDALRADRGIQRPLHGGRNGRLDGRHAPAFRVF